jgi:hypothetical protein
MGRRIVGDPLTGSLPKTQLVIPSEVLGPVRTPRVKRIDAWPLVPDPLAISSEQMRAGRIAVVRTRLGIRRYQIRTLRRSAQRPNRGRHFFVGQTRRGWCRPVWLDRVIRVESVQKAIRSR